MKIQCDVCEKATATVICCADEAALCANCDVEIHAANKLASKHQRLKLQFLSNKLPLCDICQEKAAFIFCVEDRALFCRDCDEPIHCAGRLSGSHQRLLATGIRVALNSTCANDPQNSEPPNPPVAMKTPTPQPPPCISSSWAVDDLLQFSDFEPSDKKEPAGFGELEWFSGMGLFDDQVPQAQETLAAAEVPQLPMSTSNNAATYKTTRSSHSSKKPKIEISDDDEYFTVPDLG